MSKEIVTAWIRRRAERDGLAGVSHFVDAHDRAKRLHELWNARFPHCPYIDFRRMLARIAEEHAAPDIPRLDNWRDADAEWVAPIDDDDWHLAGLADALAQIPADFVMVCWPVKIANLTRNPTLYVEPIHWATGPHSCGYAVRKSWLETLTPRQFALMRDDHRHVHRYVDFSGHKYLFLDQPYAQYVFTPASISSIPDHKTTALNIATAQAYAAIAADCPPGVQEVALTLATLPSLTDHFLTQILNRDAIRLAVSYKGGMRNDQRRIHHFN